MKRLRRLALILTGLALAVPVQSDTPKNRETFTAFAVNLGSSTRATATSHVTVTIDRWSTDDERRRLVGAFTEGGPEAFLKEVQKIKPLGRLFTPDSIGYDLKYAHQMPLASGGRRILIATDRPLGYWEQVNRPRTADYPFTVIEMRLDRRARGRGR